MMVAAKLLVTGAILVACGSGDRPKVSNAQVEKTFPAEGVTRVTFRAALAQEARVVTAEGKSIKVTGIPRGGAAGYHPQDPKWRETPASKWGLDFRAKAFGKTLVISTVNEIRYIHHGYQLEQLVITVPADVEVVREARQLSGDGAPDLGEPSGP
jgi:hypothetical protein